MEITDHKINELNEVLTITADERDSQNGNASHQYLIKWYEKDQSGCELEIEFQHGPIKENGVNGVSNEALLAIVIDRLRGFQSGKYACTENSMALTKMEDALEALHSRTRTRVARGVEGTHEV